MNEVSQIANSPIIWIVSSVSVGVVIMQSVIFMRLAKKNAVNMGATADECKVAFRTGIISSIGPAIAIFVALIGLMTTIGGPISWLRLAMIGSAPTELGAVGAATTSLGIPGAKLGDLVYTKEALAVTWWTLALNGCGWLIFSAVFSHKLESVREKVGGGDAKWLTVLSSAAMLGIFGYLSLNSVVRNKALNTSAFIAAITGGIVMFGCIKLSKKLPKIKEYSLGIAILFGIAVATIL